VVNPQTRLSFHRSLLCLRNPPDIFQGSIAPCLGPPRAGSEGRSASV